MLSQIIPADFSSFPAKITFNNETRFYWLRVFYCWEWQKCKMGAVSLKP